MILQKIILCNNEARTDIERLVKMKIKYIRCLPNKTIHSNPIYTGKINKKRIVIKFYKSKEIMQKELYCNFYLNSRGLVVPNIIFSDSAEKHYIVMEMIGGSIPPREDIYERVKSLAKIHAGSLIESNLVLKESLPKITKQDRLNSLKKYFEILETNNLIEKTYLSQFEILEKLIIKTDSSYWDNCFCFNDFFINNSLKSNNRIYYFDFERACISNPFIDVGCIVINYPEKSEEIKKEYIQNIQVNLKSENFKIDQSNLSLLLDLGICEKVIEDAAFLSNDSIKKTKTNSFCKKLAKRKVESVSFVFERLKNSLMGEK